MPLFHGKIILKRLFITIIIINIFNVAEITKLLQGPRRNRKRVHIVSEYLKGKFSYCKVNRTFL